MTPSRRVLIVSASIGGGHVAAGRALEAAFGEAGVPARHVDLLDYTSAPFRALYRRSYFDLVRTAPEMVEFLGRRLDRSPTELPARSRRVGRRLARLASYQLPRWVDAYRPDLVVHTHFLSTGVLGSRRTGAVPQAVVVTDYGAHALWLAPDVARYFVAAEEVAVHLRASGVDGARVAATGIPVDPRFARLETPSAARARLGLPPDVQVLLVSLSGLDAATAARLLEEVKRTPWPLRVQAICGRSSDLLEVATAAAADPSDLVRIDAFGMRQDVPTLLAAADLVVGKPGGLTVAEALAAGRPFVVVDPYPLQEEANATFLLEHGAGLRVEPLTTLPHKLGTLLRDPARFAAMRDAARAVGRPHAARDVVAGALELVAPEAAPEVVPEDVPEDAG